MPVGMHSDKSPLVEFAAPAIYQMLYITLRKNYINYISPSLALALYFTIPSIAPFLLPCVCVTGFHPHVTVFHGLCF